MKKMTFLYRMIRGAVGKEFVVKHYKGGRIVVTRFPDMSGIVASGKQRIRRDLFREAVVYARWIVADEGRKKAFRKTLPRKKRRHVYQAAISLYMSKQGDKQWLRKQLAVKAMTRIGTEDVLVKSSNAMWWRREGESARFSEIWNFLNFLNFLKRVKVRKLKNGAYDEGDILEVESRKTSITNLIIR